MINDEDECPLWATMIYRTTRGAVPAWWWCAPGEHGICAERLVAAGRVERRDTPRGPLYRVSPLAYATWQRP